MNNLLQPTKGGIVEMILGRTILVIILGLLAFFTYKKSDHIIKCKFSNALIIGYSVVCSIFSVFVILGAYVMLTSEPNIALIIVAVFMLIFPSAVVLFTCFVPILAIIKTILRKVKLNLVAIIFASIASLGAIASVVLLIIL